MSIVLSQLDHQNSGNMHGLPMMPLSLPLAAIQEREEAHDHYLYYDSDLDDEGSLFSIDFNNCTNPPIIQNSQMKNDEIDEDERIYHVAVDVMNSESSMDALLWTISQALTYDHYASSSIKALHRIRLVHVFPPVRYIPSPLGMLPRSKVSPKLVKQYTAQERNKRTKLLDKYVDACLTAKIAVDIMLIENDRVLKAILNLIHSQNVKNLIVGATKSSLRFVRKLGSRKGSGIAYEIKRNAPPEPTASCCDIKIIYKGKEVLIDEHVGSPTSRSSNAYSMSTRSSNAYSMSTLEDLEVPPRVL